MSIKIHDPKDDPIGYLCKRRYPLAYQEDRFGATHAELAPFRDADEKADAYRKELEALPHEEMVALFNAEYQKERKYHQERLEREEQALFFHRPEAQANFAHWCKMAIWSLDEAIALSLGKNPAEVNWPNVSMRGERFVPQAWSVSEFPKEYARRKQLVARAKKAGQLFDPISPERFLRWAVEVFDTMPDELLARFSTSTAATESESLAGYPPELRAAIEAFKAVRSDPSALAGRSPRDALERWLEVNKPEIGFNARKRIATVANWSPKGGAPTTPTGKPTLGG